VISLTGLFKPEEVIMAQEDKPVVVLKVNDREVEINSFVQGVIRNIVMGVLSSLKLDDEAETVELRIHQP